jgi:uncharacterized protein (DUF983 family)
MSKYPISNVCPSCGHTRFQRTYPDTIIAFKSDRICLECGTRYTPATPRWAAVVFILLGFFFAWVLVSLILAITFDRFLAVGDRGVSRSLVVGIASAFVVVAAAVIYGVRIVTRKTRDNRKSPSGASDGSDG